MLATMAMTALMLTVIRMVGLMMNTSQLSKIFIIMMVIGLLVILVMFMITMMVQVGDIMVLKDHINLPGFACQHPLRKTTGAFYCQRTGVLYWYAT